MSLTRNEADADDLVDEAVVRALRADPDLRTEHEVHAYVLTAIRNTWFNWTRVRGRHRALLVELRRMPGECASSALQAFVEAEQQNRVDEALARALERMDPKIKAAIGLYLLKDPGLTLREIAEEQSVSVTTAHTRVQQALRMLAEALEEMKP